MTGWIQNYVFCILMVFISCFLMVKLILNKDKIFLNNVYILYLVLILYNYYIEIKFFLLL